MDEGPLQKMSRFAARLRLSRTNSQLPFQILLSLLLSRDSQSSIYIIAGFGNESSPLNSMGNLPLMDLEDGILHEVVSVAEHFEPLQVVLLQGFVLCVILRFKGHNRIIVRTFVNLW